MLDFEMEKYKHGVKCIVSSIVSSLLYWHYDSFVCFMMILQRTGGKFTN